MQSRFRANIISSRSTEMIKLRFPQKLWIIVNDSNGIAEWSRNGTAVSIDIDALDAYLLSEDSIFRTRNHCSFERQMLLYGFQRLGGHTLASGRASFATMEPDEMELRHENFKRDKPNLVDSIRKRFTANDRNFKILKMPQTIIEKRRRPGSDPCKRLNQKLRLTANYLNHARLRLRTLLRERSVQAMLSLKLDRCVRTNNWSIELKEEVFENAADSVSGFEQREVAGFYGHDVTSEQIKSFFGEYLPTYSNDEGLSSLPAPNPPESSSSYPNESFSIPQFQIVANPHQSNDDLNPYSLQMVNESNDCKPGPSSLSNHLTPIDYDISFLDAANHEESDFNPNSIKEEFTTMQEQLDLQHQQEATFDDDDDDNFEIDDFFRIKPRPAVPQVATQDHYDNEAIKVEEGGEKDTTEGDDQHASTNSTECEETTAANDIIQQAALIDDDFFSQIRESMDVLYDKILC